MNVPVPWPCTERLTLRPAAPSDALDIFAAVTPALTRYLSFDPAPYLEALQEIVAGWQPAMAAGTELHMALRHLATGAFVGMAGAQALGAPTPELGIWIREEARRRGFGREAVAGLKIGLSTSHAPEGFHYLVAEPNVPSHRIARSLGGIAVGFREHRKYRAVIYLLPAAG